MLNNNIEIVYEYVMDKSAELWYLLNYGSIMINNNIESVYKYAIDISNPIYIGIVACSLLVLFVVDQFLMSQDFRIKDIEVVNQDDKTEYIKMLEERVAIQKNNIDFLAEKCVLYENMLKSKQELYNAVLCNENSRLVRSLFNISHKNKALSMMIKNYKSIINKYCKDSDNDIHIHKIDTPNTIAARVSSRKRKVKNGKYNDFCMDF